MPSFSIACAAIVETAAEKFVALTRRAGAHGTIAQGVGEALWEQIYLDPSSSQLLTGSFMDYTRPHGLPSFRTGIDRFRPFRSEAYRAVEYLKTD
jgi:hypothetical protein